MAQGFFSRLLRQEGFQTRLKRGARRARRTAARGTELRLEHLEDRRMLAAGDLDTTFNPSGTLPPGTLLPPGQQGIVISHFGGATAEVEAHSVVQLGTGKLLVAGRYQSTGSVNNRSFMVARYNTDGTLDTTFGASDSDGINGVAIIDVIAGQEDFALDLGVDSQNRIVMAGRAGNGFDVAVVRLLPEGALDTSFSGDGIVVTSSGTAEWNPNALAIDVNDSIVVAGYTNPAVGDDDFLVLRYTDAGVLDTTFGGTGIVTIGFNAGRDDQAFDVAIQPDGKIVVGGTGQIVASTVRDFALARLNPNGSLDLTFDTDGKVMTEATIASDNIEAIVIESTGKIVVAGQASGTGGGFSIIARYDASGLLDTSTFNPSGPVPGTLRINVDNLTATTESSLGLAIQQDGKYVVAGRFVTGSDNRLLVARATPAGVLDTSFGGPGLPDGVITNLYSGSVNERFSDVIVQSDGKIVATGQGNNNDLVLARYESGQVIQSIAGAADVNEGGVYTLSLNATDPTITSWTIDWGDSIEVVAGNPSSVTHTYADGNASYTISAWVTTPLGTTPIANTVNVVVQNVAPTLVISGALSIAEGSVYTLNLSASDPGQDTITSWTINWGDSIEVVSGNPASVTHTYADGAIAYVVSATATDEDGTFNSNSISVTVDDVVPTLVISGAASVAEGGIYTLSLSSSDPGTDTITSWTINWGDSIEVVSGNPASVTHTYADGSASYIISATATNEDGTFSSNSVTVTVDDVVPTLVISGAATVDEGSVYTLSLSSSDPGDDTITSWTINWGDSVEVVSGNPASVTHTYADGSASYTISATATNEDGTFSSNNVTVSVDDVAPTLVISGAASVAEGGIYMLSLSSSDPGTDTITSWTINWGDSIEVVSGNPASVTHTYADGSASYIISATATNEDGTFSSNSVAVSVVNVAPTLVISGAASVDEGSVYTLNLSSSDPGTDTITSWTINWGDSVQVVSGNPASVTHTYADGTVTYTVTATATDEDGTFSSNSIAVTVNNVAPTANIGGPYTVGEGGSITLNGSATDPAGPADPLTFAWDLDNNGTFETSGANPVFSAAGIDGPATRTIHLRVTDGDGGVAVVTTTVNIVNVAPTANAGGPYFTFDDTPIVLSGSGSDPAGAADPLTFQWDLDGDGVFGETGSGATRGNEVGANPTFNPTGLGNTTQTVKLRTLDGDGGVSSVATATIQILGQGTVVIGGVLHIVGSNTANDVVVITRVNNKIQVCASFNNNNPLLFNIADISEIQVRTRGGNDIVVVANNVTLPTTIDGGAGNDVLTGGGGHTVIYGGDGNDVLVGGPGNNVLIGGNGTDVIAGGAGLDLIVGGRGSDVLSGGSGDDILIGGYTLFDANTASSRASIDAIMAIWTSGGSFAARVAALTGSGGLLQAGITVLDDDSCDVLSGDGGRDLLFGDTSMLDGAIDLIAWQQAQDILLAVN